MPAAGEAEAAEDGEDRGTGKAILAAARMTRFVVGDGERQTITEGREA